VYETHHDQGESDDILATVQKSDVENFRASGSRHALTVTVGNVDLPAFISNGLVYIQAPLPNVFEAFGESLPEFVRDLEIGVSTTRGTPLSLDGNGRAVLIPPMAEQGVVRSRRFDR
jgi:hypothetical protein